eukprot:jgi/Phyca11/130865/e_gw1.98.64.1
MKLSLFAAITFSCLFAVSAGDASALEDITTAPSSTGLVCGTQLKNIYYHGFNLQTSTVSDAAACCSLCSTYSGCVLYTYFHSSSTGQSLCYLKSGAGEKTNYADSSSVTAVSAFMVSSTTAPTPTTTTTATPKPTAACAAEGQYCGNAQGTSCCESGSYCQPWNTYYYQCIGLPDGCGNLETDVDYYGNDLGSALTLYPWLCCSLCQKTDGCNAYTFVNLDPAGPTCYMKTSSAGRVSNVGALSGVPLNKTT